MWPRPWTLRLETLYTGTDLSCETKEKLLENPGGLDVSASDSDLRAFFDVLAAAYSHPR